MCTLHERNDCPSGRWRGHSRVQVQSSVSRNKKKLKLVVLLNVRLKGDTSQAELYKEVSEGVVEKLLENYNASILAYGQTGTGKSFTMIGSNADDPTELQDLKGLKQHLQGITPRILKDLYESLFQLEGRYSWSTACSYLEIYNEHLNDLLLSEEEMRTLNYLANKKPLSPQERKQLAKRKLKIVQLGKTIGVVNATQVQVRTDIAAYDLLMRGAANRMVAATNSNKESSRSHAIFIITLQIDDVVTKSRKASQLYLVDLAGSEQVKKTLATGERLDEAKMINKSLFALGNVIYALSSDKPSHVPYRDRFSPFFFFYLKIGVLYQKKTQQAYETPSELYWREQLYHFDHKLLSQQLQRQ